MSIDALVGSYSPRRIYSELEAEKNKFKAWIQDPAKFESENNSEIGQEENNAIVPSAVGEGRVSIGSNDLWLIIEKKLQSPFSEARAGTIIHCLERLPNDLSIWQKTAKEASPAMRSHIILHICNFWSNEEWRSLSTRMAERRMDMVFYGILANMTSNQIDVDIIKNAPADVRQKYILMSQTAFPIYKRHEPKKVEAINSWKITE